MNIPVNKLKKFQKLASNIKTNGILPIYGYLRFGGGCICKNVGTSFIEYNLEEADEEILVDEHDLFSLLNHTSSSFISITLKKGKVELNDGRDKLLLNTVKYSDFNAPDSKKKEPLAVSAEFMDAVSKASHFAVPVKDMPTYYAYVHIGENTVCAGDGHMIFHCPVEEDLSIVLEGKIAQFVAKQGVTAFADTGNYHLFFTLDAVLGFAKSELNWFNIKKVFERPREYSFTLDVSDITSFNSLSLQLTRDPMVTISNGKFEMNDMLLDKSYERAAENIKVKEPFSYSPEKMNIAVNGLDCQEIDFSDGGPCYFLSNKDVKATTIIAKITKQ